MELEQEQGEQSNTACYMGQKSTQNAAAAAARSNNIVDKHNKHRLSQRLSHRCVRPSVLQRECRKRRRGKKEAGGSR